METYYAINTSNALYHYGVKGQKWGKRRYQNSDGTLTPEGIVHYGRKKEMNGISRVIWENNTQGGPIDPIGSAILSGVGTTLLSGPLYGAATAAAVLAGTAGYNAVIKKVANHKINKDDNIEKAHNALGLDYESQLNKSNRKAAVEKYINK